MTSTLEEKLQQGIQQQLAGKFQSAENHFQEVLADDPANADAWNLLGVLRLQSQEYDEAQRCLRKALRARPNHADGWYNMAGAHYAAGNYEEASEAYRQVVHLEPDCLEAHKGLAWCYRHAGQMERAFEAIHRVLKRDPFYEEAHRFLVDVFTERGDHHNSAVAHFNLGESLRRRRDPEGAAEAFRRALELRPDYAKAQFSLAALEGESPSNAPVEVVRDLFDSYADRFEEHLGSLQYRVPDALFDGVHSCWAPDYVAEEVVDLGCGTGLCGELFRPRSRRLFGVDLAPKMVEIAKRRGVYDDVHEADICEFLTHTSIRFDLFLAADVFIYVGALERSFASIAASAAPGALFAFSIEHWDGDGFQLLEHGRFAHSPGYIEDLATLHGFTERIRHPETLRMQSGEPVSGHIYILEASRSRLKATASS